MMTMMEAMTTADARPRDRLVIFDFDGSLTAATRDERYEAEYRSALGYVLGRPIEDRPWHGALERVDTEPADHGWRFEGRLVATASDVFLRVMAAAELIVRERAPELDDHRVRDILDSAHARAADDAQLIARPDLGVLLETVPAHEGVVVTNASTMRVSRRAEELNIRWKIAGEAQKFRVDPAISERGDTYGLKRALYPVRPSYQQIIERELGALSPRALTVAGDNLELDLLAPDRLGSRVILLTNERTQPWELSWIRAKPSTRAVAASLTEAAALLKR